MIKSTYFDVPHGLEQHQWPIHNGYTINAFSHVRRCCFDAITFQGYFCANCRQPFIDHVYGKCLWLPSHVSFHEGSNAPGVGLSLHFYALLRQYMYQLNPL